VDHKRFQGTKSRKGYLRTKWKFGTQECNLINIHLYHDDLNTTAVSNIPSIYASERSKALKEIVNGCNLSNTVPAFIFGDFNTRLDADFIEWIKTEYNDEGTVVVVKEKDFFFQIFNRTIQQRQITKTSFAI